MRSKFMALEKRGKLRVFFLLLCGQSVIIVSWFMWCTFTMAADARGILDQGHRSKLKAIDCLQISL